MMRVPEVVIQACGRVAVGEPARYAAGRLFELVHPATHFSQSASFVLSPQLAVSELVRLAKTFVENEDVRYPQLEAGMDRVRHTLSRTYPRAAKWWPEESRELLVNMQAALDPALHLKGAEAREALVPGVRELVVPSAERLLREYERGRPSLLGRLLGQVTSAIATGAPSTLAEWRAFDADLSQLTACALLDARDGYHLALSFCERLLACTSPADAANALTAELQRPKSNFTVALVLDGARRIRDCDAFGCDCLSNPASWPTPSRHDGRLRSFLTPLVAGRQAVAISIPVDAYDPADAYVRGRAKAQRLRDQLLATHRGRGLRLLVDGLVIAHDTDTVSRQPVLAPGIHETSPIAPVAAHELAPALRFAALARDEAMHVMRVTHAWVALERLAQGARLVQRREIQARRLSPGTFVPPRVGALMSLTAARAQWAASWQVASRAARASARRDDWLSLERALGVKGDPLRVPLRRWADVLTAADTSPPKSVDANSRDPELRAFALAVLDDVNPYAAWRLRHAGRLLSNGDVMSNWALDIVSGPRSWVHLL